MWKQIVFILIVITSTSAAFGQVNDSVHYLSGMKENGDTIPHIELKTIPVFPRTKFKSKRLERKYWRLAMKVKKVYPYARVAAELMAEYDAKYRASDNKKERKEYLKEAEAELFDRYGDELKKLSISEGRILIKLIDRETQHTSYELIKDLKGGVSAFFWQGIARLFGNNLKEEYDPDEEDKMIEEIIYYIEAGVI
ncbi:DUF4294 domain-containing protein [Mangrovibacterium diazotrophicum]|uniref:Uncharacterized protein DUF4294 n=1 Tax=Mangrovibacterium diazotrophicum TaxID=1261403 RepID=A0A419WBC4_9BACT|nr:DUF4294 domain-containing protein [Mangrovibacterium diazotrophicum]RKD92765.1 uncharacterized protein DUF4294 [Mangrovibacterium diazotrophicum]